MDCSGVFPTTKFAHRKGLGTYDELLSVLCMPHTLKNALENGQETRILQIDFSAAFDGVNHHGIIN